MAKGSFTIRDPLSQRPDLVLNRLGPQDYQRALVQGDRIDRLNQHGSGVRLGTFYGSQYTWAITAKVQESEALALQSFIRIQRDRTNLILIDEIERVPLAEYENNQRSIVLGSEANINGEIAAYCAYSAFLAVDENPMQDLGCDSAGVRWKEMSFSIIELPNVAA